MLKHCKKALLLLDPTVIYISSYDEADLHLLYSSHAPKILYYQILITTTMIMMKEQKNAFKVKLEIFVMAHFHTRDKIN